MTSLMMNYHNSKYSSAFYVFFYFVYLTNLNLVQAQFENNFNREPEAYYTTMEIVCSQGYSVQEHEVVTKDGYILTVHRIPRARNRPPIPPRYNHYRKIHLDVHPDFESCVRESFNVTSNGLPILFVHGVLMASDGWVLQGAGYDLAFLMADSGFDVWLANVRGNFYSRKHLTLSPSDPAFWDFSFHEHALYDIPATIDYILQVTKKDKIGYIGYSMGTTVFFAMASSLSEYNDKILGFVGLAPVAFIKEKNQTEKRKSLYDFLKKLMRAIEKKRVYELFPRNNRVIDIGKNYCARGVRQEDLCYDLVSAFLGYRSKITLRSKFYLYVTHIPAGTSIKNFKHFTQTINGNTFKAFDYGSTKNVHIYGTPTPPEYHLERITAPVALYYSTDDFSCNEKDVNDLRAVLPNVIDVDVKHKFNHGDYLWSFRAKDILYPRAINFFRKLADQYYLQYRKKKSFGS